MIFKGMDNLKDLAPVLSAATALLAVLIGPLVTLRISRRQVLAPMRQSWIGQLRDTIAEFVSIASIFRWNIVESTSAPAERKRAAEREDLKRYERLLRLHAQANLLINPREETHRALVAAMADIIHQYHQGEPSDEQRDELIHLSQQVLKSEWEVTKKH